MPPVFVDTNVFIRYLTGDHPGQSARALAFLQQLETGDRTATTCEGVLVETVQVLSSKVLYNYPREQIKEALSEVLGLRSLQIPHKQIYLRALEVYASTNLDFVDTICIAHMEQSKIATIVSFDHDFDRISGITRREP